MTIVEQEIMDPNENLEAELDDGDHDPYDVDDDYGVEEEDASDDEPSAHGNPEVAEWVSLTTHPAPTATRILQCLRRVSSRGRNSITILMLGRASVGKSSTANSLFAITVAQAYPFHMLTYQAPQPLVIRKRAEGVTLTVIDTPRVIDSDAVSDTNLRRIALQARNDPVDVVLYLDRLDMHKPDELDAQVMSNLTQIFGREIWSRMVIGLTRSDVRDPAPGETYDSLVTKRVEGLRDVMRKAGGRNATLPYVLIENSDRCGRNAAGEKILENGSAWIPTLFETIVDVAQSFPAPYRFNPRLVNRSAQLFTKFCLIPLVLVTQIIVKLLILDRVISDDGTKQDRYGPFDQLQQEYERKKRAQARIDEAEVRAARHRATRRPRGLSLEDEISADSDDESE